MDPADAAFLFRAVLIFSAGFVGAVVASYLGVVAERGWRGSASGRSVCVCGRQLAWWENVPVVSWLVLRGRSRCCKVALPARYVTTEALLGGTVALVVGGAGVLLVSRAEVRHRLVPAGAEAAGEGGAGSGCDQAHAPGDRGRTVAADEHDTQP